MSSRLDNALKRLDAAVAALESQPAITPETDHDIMPKETASIHGVSQNAAEISEIRGLIDQAMAVISQQNQGGSDDTK